jgi:hypothetical protein
MFEFFSILTLIPSVIAAIASAISAYHLLTSKPKLRVLLNGEEKELTVKADEVYESTLRIINLRNVATELSRVIIKFPSSFKPLYSTSPEITNKQLKRYIPKDFSRPLDVVPGPVRIIAYPQEIIGDSEVIFVRKGVLPWNLPGKGYLDFLIYFRTPTEYKNYTLEIIVQTTSKTFIKNLNIKVIKGNKS